MITQLNYYYDQADRRKALYATKTTPPSHQPNITKEKKFLTPTQKLVTSATERKVVNTKTGEIYASITDACETNDISRTKMFDRLKYGKEWQYLEELRPVIAKIKDSRIGQTKCVSVIFIPTGEKFESISDAIRVKRTVNRTITKHCLGNQKGEQLWRYV